MNFEKNIPLNNLSSAAVGGKADFFCEIKSEADLDEALAFAQKKKLPVFVMGGGSNTVFSDQGFRGLIIRDQISDIQIEGNQVRVTAGTPLPLLNRALMEHQLSGLEKIFGLPGTIGGAVVGNAGIPKCEISDVLVGATILDMKTGEKKEVKKSWFKFGYRESVLKHKEKDKFLLSIEFTMKPGSKDTMEKVAFGEISSRKTKQPIGKSTGSFFKNPNPKNTAGNLIDKAGLKGLKLGGVLISDKHANFFLNTGRATQKDFIDIGKKVKREIKKQFGIILEAEALFIDEQGKPIKI